MISKIEDNDNTFTGFWSNAENLECGTLFLNHTMSNDIFFDKLTNITCLSEKMVKYAVEKFYENDSKPYVYSIEYPELSNLLEKLGFRYYDTQYALCKKGLQSQNHNITRIGQKEIDLWASIFCEAYDCKEWKSAVDLVLKNSQSSVEYYVDNSYSSCMALYEKNSILGLYCLGTIPDKRRQGIAKSLIDFALSEVKSRGLDFLLLETYGKDNLMNFYSKLGFDTVYEKTVYTI